LHMKPRLK